MNHFKLTSNSSFAHKAALLLGVLFVTTTAAAFLIAPVKAAADVHGLFDIQTPGGGPFPSDLFTVSDVTQITGLRINLPKPDCAIRPTDCEDLDVINTIDGFNQLPRLSIPFDNPIDVETATSDAVFIISLGSTVPGGENGGRVVGINRIVWDPLKNTLHAEADELLGQHTRYALVVTNRLRDSEGGPVQASENFLRFRQDLNNGQTNNTHLKEYRKALLEALAAARAAGVQESEVVSASVFTTQSATAVMEKIRDQIKEGPSSPVDFNLGSDGTRTVFPLDNVDRLIFRPQVRENPVTFGADVTLPLSLLRFIPGSVGQIAFGKYQSPQYIVHPGEYIPEVGTLTGTPQVRDTTEVFFNLIVPSGTPPPAGWPVAIFGHGSPTNKNNQPLEVASVMASHGIATIAINYVGNGSGPLGTLTVSQLSGLPVTLPAGGRSLDQNHDNNIDEGEGRNASSPWTIIANRDTARQTVADMMQLVRVIQGGIDVDDDGSKDLDPSRIHFFGHSAGGTIGPMFLAVEPDVHAGVFNAIATPFDGLRLSPLFRPGIGRLLALRGLLNTPGLSLIDGVPTPPPLFNENLPKRNEPALVNTVAGAIQIQESLDYMKWVGQSASSLVYAPYLRKTPLQGVPAKSVIFQIGKGDQRAANPLTSAILRAGELADRATFIRNDLAFAENPAVAKDPHLLIRSITVPSVAAIARGVQEQIGVFFASGGAVMIYPEPVRFFEVPIAPPLPEDQNFIP